MTSVIYESTWWEEAFPAAPYKKSPPGEKKMLVLIAYDISNQKRLSRVAALCEDFGQRVQYSIFECHLESDKLVELWDLLLNEIDPSEDRVVAYQLDARNAKATLTAGTMICTEKVACYLV